uniref:hypothetical protein n=1 Tax=Aliarcobacter sp. TaxID=2321116 RepID=UPI0040481311
MKKLVYSILLSSLSLISVNAHEIWLELDEKRNEAKLFFGEFDGKQTESGEKFSRIKEGISYPTDLVKEVKRNDNNVTYTLSKKSDIAVVRTSEPRKARNSEIVENKISYTKAGRTSIESIVDFDIVPLSKDSNSFKLVFKNEPIKKSKVKVISPTGWEKIFEVNDKGEFTIHTPWIGKYLLQASLEDETKGEIDGKVFDKTVHSISYTIEVNQGLPWETKK